jgi:murein DD-endopeptidase MepM/ murein hydrolase activator NlpD
MTETIAGASLQHMGSMEIIDPQLQELDEILRAQEQNLIRAMIRLYYKAGITEELDYMVNAYVETEIRKDAQLKKTVENGLRELDKFPDDATLFKAGDVAINLFKDAAHHRAYVSKSVQRVIRGQGIDKGQIETFAEIQDWSRTNGKTQEGDGQIHPAHDRIIKSVFSGVKTVLDDDNPAPHALRELATIAKAVSPSMDHKINQTLVMVIDLLCDIQDGEKFTDDRFEELVETMGFPVSEEVRQFGQTAHENYDLVVTRIGNYYAKQSVEDPDKAQQLKKLFDYLEVEFDETENFLLVPYDPQATARRAAAEAEPDFDEEDYLANNPSAGPSVNVNAHVRSEYDHKTGDVRAHMTFVPKKPDTGRIISGIAAASTLVGGLIGVTSGDNDHESSEYVVPHSQTHNQGTTEAGRDITNQPATTPEDQAAAPATPAAPEAPAPALPDPGVAAGGLEQPGATNHSATHHAAQPAVPAEVHLSQIQGVGAPSHGEARPVTNGHDQQAVEEALRNDLAFKDLPDATTVLETNLLKSKPEAPESQNEAFTTQVDRITNQTDEYVKHMLDKGEITTEQFAAYREMVASARVLAQRPELAGTMDAQKANLLTNGDYSQFIQGYIEKTLAQHNMLGGFEKSDQYDLIAQFLGSAAATVISPKDQSQWLIAHGYTIQTPDPAPAESSPGQGNPGDQGNGQGSENPGSTPESGTTNLSPAESAALDKMESMGGVWNMRAIAMRGFMQKGWSIVEASGMVGNANYESGLDPGKHQNDGGPGRGWFQWGSYVIGSDRFGFEPGAEHRVGTLVWYAASHNLKWNDPQAQIGFADWELNNSQKAAGDALRNATSAKDAANIFLMEFERPADPSQSRDARETFAQDTYDMLQKLIGEQENAASNPNTGPAVNGDYFPAATDILAYMQDKYNGDQNGKLKPEDLQLLGNNWPDARLYPAAAQAFRLFSASFQEQFGRPLELSGGADDAYRDFAEQQKLKQEKPFLAAVPGTSNHGFGLATDLGGGVNSKGSPEFNWTLQHAGDFGFVHPDWAINPSNPNFKDEPWHMEYVGDLKIDSAPAPGNSDHQDQGNNGNGNGGTSPDNQGNGNQGQGNPGQGNQNTDPGQGNGGAEQQDNGPLVSQKGFGLPVLITQYVIGTKYEGYSNDGNGNVHTGLDILAKKGSPALAVKNATVHATGYDDGAGYYVILDLENGPPVVYQHLDKIGVKEGQQINLGDEVGKVGNTGRVISSTGDGTHLHFEVNAPGDFGIASHTETVAQVESETDDPLDFLPTLQEISNYEDAHHIQRAIGEAALDATDGQDVAGDLPDKTDPPVDAPANNQGHGNEHSDSHANEHSNEQPGNSQKVDANQSPVEAEQTPVDGTNGNSNQLESTQQQTPYDQAQIDGSAQ